MLSYKTISWFLFTMGILAFFAEKLAATHRPQQTKESFYDFKMKALSGEEIDFSRYKGKKILIVNTASRCGYTHQYKDLEKLHQQYGDKVTVLGFPSNNFLWQEPGSDNDIAAFCERNYGVDFQMFSKISVKGKHQHPLYQWLEKKSGKSPSWNFCKYILDENGEVLAFFPSGVEPLDPKILNLIR